MYAGVIGDGTSGQMTPMTPGQISYYKHLQRDDTPKYIKDLRSELSVALKKNFDLKNQLEKLEE